MSKPKTMMIDDIEYIRADSVQAMPKGIREVVVVDRGWIFAGDVEEKEDSLVLTDAVNVRRWDSIGFEGMIDKPTSSKVTTGKLSNPVVIPLASVLFRVPVNSDWCRDD